MFRNFDTNLLINKPVLWSFGIFNVAGFLVIVTILFNLFNIFLAWTIIEAAHSSSFEDRQLQIRQMWLIQLLFGIGIIILFLKSLSYDGSRKQMHRPLSCLLSRYLFYLLACILFCLIIHLSFDYYFGVGYDQRDSDNAATPAIRTAYFVYLRWICIGISICTLIQIGSWFRLKDIFYSSVIVLINALLTFFPLSLIFSARYFRLFLTFILVSEFLLITAYFIKRTDKRWQIAPIISPVLIVTVVILEKMAGWYPHSDTDSLFALYMLFHVFIILPACICTGYKAYIEPYYK